MSTEVHLFDKLCTERRKVRELRAQVDTLKMQLEGQRGLNSKVWTDGFYTGIALFLIPIALGSVLVSAIL